MDGQQPSVNSLCWRMLYLRREESLLATATVAESSPSALHTTSTMLTTSTLSSAFRVPSVSYVQCSTVLYSTTNRLHISHCAMLRRHRISEPMQYYSILDFLQSLAPAVLTSAADEASAAGF